MSAPVMPRAAVDAPVAPVPHRYGLFSVATVLEQVPPHELTGVEYETICTPQVDLYPAPCTTADPTVKAPKATVAPSVGTPFAVYAADACMLGRDPGEARTQLRQRFAAAEETAVERAISTGDLSWPHLAAAEVLDAGGATDPDLKDALGLLAQWLAERVGGAGVIHSPMWLAYQSKGLMTVTGPRATTLLGDGWVFGTGYTGNGPDGTASDTVWLYATAPIRVRRSALIEPGDWSDGAFSREENLGFLLAERLYIVDWPCGAAAIKTSIPRYELTPPAPEQP
jgi:hypothetical protein